MNREIKFRGWSERLNKWVYGDLINFTDGHKSIRDYQDYNHYNVIPESVGQYTGLKDANGMEIYEGDLVKYFNYVSAYQIYWEKFAAGFMMQEDTNSANVEIILVGLTTVIGNKFEALKQQ